FEFGSAIIQSLKKLLRAGSDIIDLLSESVEVHVRLRGQQSAIGSRRGLRCASQNFEMVIAQGADAHYLDVAVGFDGQIRLNAEGNVDTRRTLGNEAQAPDPAYFWSPGIAHRGGSLEAAREGKLCMVGRAGAAKGSAHAEKGGE